MMPAFADIGRATACPLPSAIDEIAAFHNQLELDLAEARQKVSDAHQVLAERERDLIELVRNFGGPHATKSKILHGIVWEIVATFSQYTTQDSAAIERFRLALVAAKQTRLLKKIFRADTRWIMQPDAGEIIRAAKISPRLMALLLQCSVTQDRKPSLDVRPKKKPAA